MPKPLPPDWPVLLADDPRDAVAPWENPLAGWLRAAAGLPPPGVLAVVSPCALSPRALAARLRRRLPRAWTVGVADEAYVVVADGAVALAVVVVATADGRVALFQRRGRAGAASRVQAALQAILEEQATVRPEAPAGCGRCSLAHITADTLYAKVAALGETSRRRPTLADAAAALGETSARTLSRHLKHLGLGWPLPPRPGR